MELTDAQDQPLLRLRPANLSDLPALIELQNDALGIYRDIGHARWKYLQNPSGEAFISIGTNESEDILAGYSMIPIRLNWAGKLYLGAQTTDTVIHPSYRGRGILKELYQHATQRASSASVSFAYGFPNSRAISTNIRSIGATPILTLHGYYRRIGIRFLLPLCLLREGICHLVARLRLRTKHNFHSDSKLPIHYDDFWNQIKKHQILSVWKDRDFMEWRYSNPTASCPTYYWSEKEGTIDAFAITVNKGTHLYITDLMHADRNVFSARALIHFIGMAAVRQRITHLFFLGHDDGFFAAVLNGFDRLASNDVTLVFRPLASFPPENILTQPTAWVLTASDTDVI